MTLIDQIYLELDDVYPEYMLLIVNDTFPDLKLEDEVPNEISQQISDILSEYAK